MTTTLKDMMAFRADAAPDPHIDIEAVVRSGQRRVRRHRALGGVAAGAVLAAAALVASALHLNYDEPSFAGSGGFEVREVTYAENSTIHYGEQAIGHGGAYTMLRTDDSGSYAAWVEIDHRELPEVCRV